ncbi:MAG TPA: hypothetical protein VNS58_02700 [Puia sp.]|nr:hypothetical protein [Puia sp.]
MRRIILLSALSLMSFITMAQVQTQIIGDSVHIHSNTGTGELNLENSTDTVLGFLYNKGGGRTQFRRGLIKINDSLYLIGADTLHMNNAGATNGNTIYYVSKKYTGIARAIVSGNTLASVSSTNVSYTSQLARAIPGSMVYSYPDPFSARNAAMDAIAAGAIPNAEIVILEGNKYTIGSDDSTKNGSLDGSSPNNGTTADVQFSSAAIATDTSISSLMKNKLDMYFCTGSALTYINSSYFIYCCFNADSTLFKSGVYGQGSFYQVYGEVNHFYARFVKILNRSSYTSFHAHEVVVQQWQGFYFCDFAVASVEIDNLFTTDTIVFCIGNPFIPKYPAITGSIANDPRMLHIDVKNCRFGKGETPYPESTDFWYFITLSNNTPMEGTLVDINIGNLYMKSCNRASLMYIANGASEYNLHLTMTIDNFVQRDKHVNYGSAAEGLVDNGPGYAINNSLIFNIKSADIDAPLLGLTNYSVYPGNKSNRIYFNVGDLYKNQSAFPGGIFNLSSSDSLVGTEPLVIKVKGNFISSDTNTIINAINGYYSSPMPNRYEFSGRYETKSSGVPVAFFHANMGKFVAFTDALLINDGITPSIMADSLCNGQFCNCCQNPAVPINIPVYIRNVHANSATGSNIQQIGDTLKVVADIPAFFN